MAISGLARKMKGWASIGAAVPAGLLGTLALVGWIAELPGLTHPGGAVVSSSVALQLLLGAVGAMLLSAPGKSARWVRLAVAVVMVVSGMATFVEDVAQRDFGLGQVWYAASGGSRGVSFPGPLAPNVALMVSCIGLALGLFDMKDRGSLALFQPPIVVALVLSVMPLIGDLCGAPYLCTFAGCMKLPPITSVCSALLCLSVLSVAPERGWTAAYAGLGYGSRLTRRFTVLICALPLLVCLKNLGEQAGVYDAEFGWVLFGLVSMGAAIVLVASNAKTLNRHDLVGSIFAERYEMVDVLGRGGMSTVYKAQHKTLGTFYAIKLMHAHLLDDEPMIKRFQQEAQAAAALAHVNLIQVHDYGVTPEGEPYMVMDFLNGETLERVIDEHRLSSQECVDLFTKICEGLDHAHKKGVIHRDLKPSNIVLAKGESGEIMPKVLDFGLAKTSMFQSTNRLTKSGEVFGTPHYMSPEQCIGTQHDERSDVYSLGCIMYECLSGQAPFDADYPVDLMRKHVDEEPPAFSKELGVPDWLAAIVFKAMKKKKASRYQSAMELRNALLEGASAARREHSGAKQ
jgi:tRNA A-37 threonylcarbamoyl transferase component Bud32